MIPRRINRFAGHLTLMALLAVMAAPAAATEKAGKHHPLSIDDVLDTIAIDRVALSPDGEWIAAVIQRPARTGEVFGRNAYEIDPSRNDVWLVSRRTGEHRNLTDGAASAAGFWCATWSPDGRKLAMLSTRPEGAEPHGGNNVRLYIWDRAAAKLARASATAMMTQTRYGSPIDTLDIRGGADHSTIAQTCATNKENAPFTWLDSHRLLTVTLPEGQISALLDEYGRPFDQAAATRRSLHDAIAPTATAMGSGTERMPHDDQANQAVLEVIDTDTGAATTIANVPIHPFQGALSVLISPDGLHLAVMATTGAIQPARGQRIPHHDDAWQVEKQLGFINIAAGAAVRWVKLSTAARYPLELLGWSPDSAAVAFRARGTFEDKTSSLFVASTDLTIERRAGSLTVGTPEAGPYPHEPAAVWTDVQHLLIRGREVGAARDDWWLAGPDRAPINLTSNMEHPPEAFRRTVNNRFVATSAAGMVTLDQLNARLSPVAGISVPAGASIAWPQDPDKPTNMLLVKTSTKDRQILERISLTSAIKPARTIIPAEAEVMDVGPNDVIWRDPTRAGLFLRATDLDRGTRRDLMTLDTHLAAVDWGETRIIDYIMGDGRAMKGAVILPPGYKQGQRYPTLVWVYGGYRVSEVGDYWLDPYLPGIYNLQLYAARGYVVLVPSMPLNRSAAKNDSYPDLGLGVMPAIDRLIVMGIADPARVGVMGQSFGGYSVYSLITQTNRFKAAVAIAGLTDLTQLHDQFDAVARGYPGIEHEKSANWSIVEAGLGLGTPPFEDYARYWRNSPMAYVDRVETPLLLIHGEFDKRGALSQADTFFYSLYRQGKTARLLRYWGESHSLSQSPANIRNILDETNRWLDQYVRQDGLAAH